MAEDKFVFESIQDAHTIKGFLESLIAGLDEEKVTLASNGESIELTPNGLLEFAVKAKRKGDANRLSIRIAWKDNRKKLTANDTTLSVS